MRKFCILIAAFFALIAQPALADEIGRIKNVTSGGIDIIRSGDTVRAQSGFRLMEGDIVVTRAGQRVGITLIDNTRMSVAPSSRVIISRYRFNRAQRTGESMIEVERGALGVDSGQMSGTGNMRFRAGSSTLGVRGTHFVIEVDE
jgi:hypothetical protein